MGDDMADQNVSPTSFPPYSGSMGTSPQRVRSPRIRGPSVQSPAPSVRSPSVGRSPSHGRTPSVGSAMSERNPSFPDRIHERNTSIPNRIYTLRNGSTVSKVLEAPAHAFFSPPATEVEEIPWYYYNVRTKKTVRSVMFDVFDSFKPHANMTQEKASESWKDLPDPKIAANNTTQTPLQQTLTKRHIQMLSIGSSIGAGLFVGSADALAVAGPGSVMICYVIVAVLTYLTLNALGELCILFPVAGSFMSFSTRMIDPAFGIANGYVYAMGWLTTLPLEIISASITLRFWPSIVPQAAWITVILALLTISNVVAVRFYGEIEAMLTTIKVAAIICWMILGVVLNAGGGPRGSHLGMRYWTYPGAFHNGFRGFCSVFVNASFAYAGCEVFGLAAAETPNPRRILPSAINQIFWRLTIFYLVCLFIVGTLVPYTDPRLISGSSSVDIHTSPFVISISNAGITILPSFMNAVIMCAVLSIANSATYASSRVLAALAEQGQAPSFLRYVDRQGRPMASMAVAIAFCFLAYLGCLNKEIEDQIFTWLLSLGSLSTITCWGAILLCHIRFRKAWIVQNHTLDEIPFLAPAGVWGSWLGLSLTLVVIVAVFYTSVFPLHGKPNIVDFLTGFLCVPLLFIQYGLYKWFFRTKWIKPEDMDLDTGRREADHVSILMDERLARSIWPLWKRLYKVFC